MSAIPGQPAAAATISREDVQHVAALASLALTPEEVDHFRGDLASILGYVHELQSLDTTGVAPLTHVSELFPAGLATPLADTLRDDEPRASLSRDLIMQGAPATDGTFFKVPKVIER